LALTGYGYQVQQKHIVNRRYTGRADFSINVHVFAQGVDDLHGITKVSAVFSVTPWSIYFGNVYAE